MIGYTLRSLTQHSTVQTAHRSHKKAMEQQQQPDAAPSIDESEEASFLSPTDTPICAALFPHLIGGDDGTLEQAKAKSKWSVPPFPLPILQAFERWLGGQPAPTELQELGSAPPLAEDE